MRALRERAAFGSGAGTFGPVKIAKRTSVVADGALVMCWLTARTISPGLELEKIALTRLRIPSGQSAPEASNISSKTRGLIGVCIRHLSMAGQSSKGCRAAFASSAESAKTAGETMQSLPPLAAAASFNSGGAVKRNTLSSIAGDNRGAILPSHSATLGASLNE